MDVIGAAQFAEYTAQHPQAAPFLRALYALVARARWSGRAAVERECGAIARFETDSQVTLDLPEAGCRVTLAIHYGLGVVRIVMVTATVEGVDR